MQPSWYNSEKNVPLCLCLRLLKFLNQTTSTFTYANVTRCHPGAHELICSQPVAVRWWHIVSPPIKKSQQIYVHPRTGPHSAHLWWPAVAKLQAASCAIGQTNGRIALFQNAPPPARVEGIKYVRHCSLVVGCIINNCHGLKAQK